MIAVRGSKPSPIPSREQAVPLTLPGLLRLVPDRECTVSGLGRCRYKSAVFDDDGEPVSVTVIEGRRGAWRTVTPDRITKVHTTIKMRPTTD